MQSTCAFHLSFLFFSILQIRVVNAFRSSLYETRHYKRSMNSITSIHNFLPQINHHDDDDDDDDASPNKVLLEMQDQNATTTTTSPPAASNNVETVVA